MFFACTILTLFWKDSYYFVLNSFVPITLLDQGTSSCNRTERNETKYITLLLILINYALTHSSSYVFNFSFIPGNNSCHRHSLVYSLVSIQPGFGPFIPEQEEWSLEYRLEGSVLSWEGLKTRLQQEIKVQVTLLIITTPQQLYLMSVIKYSPPTKVDRSRLGPSPSHRPRSTVTSHASCMTLELLCQDDVV